MKLEQIIQILTLEETGSFSKAAEKLYMSQPNLSLSVKQLENELGKQIFTRSSNHLVTTAFGQELVYYLKNIQRELDNFYNFCQGDENYRLKFNIVTKNATWVNEIFADIVNRYSGSPIHFSLYNAETTEDMIEKLKTTQCELGITLLFSSSRKSSLGVYHNNNIEYFPLCSYPLHVMVGEKNPLYELDRPVSLKELGDFPLALYFLKREKNLESMLQKMGISVHSRSLIYVSTYTALYTLISQTNAVTISANVSEKNLHSKFPKVRALPIKDSDESAEFGWIKLKNIHLSDIGYNFIESIKRTLNTVN